MLNKIRIDRIHKNTRASWTTKGRRQKIIRYGPVRIRGAGANPLTVTKIGLFTEKEKKNTKLSEMEKYATIFCDIFFVLRLGRHF